MGNIEHLLEKLALGVEVVAVAVIILGIVITTSH